jgi:hypothetical protein
VAGIFNANIFNNLVFNTGATTSTGKSGWFRLWLTDMQSEFLREYEASKVKEEVVVEKVVKQLPVKEHKDGSVTVMSVKEKVKKTAPEPKKLATVEKLPTRFKLKPMYRMDTTPDYVAEVVQISSSLKKMVEGFQPVVERARKAKEENDEDEDVLFLLMAA